MPRLTVSHHVHPWHRFLVPSADGRIVLEHRGTGLRREVSKPLWNAIERAFSAPREIDEGARELVALGFESEVVSGELENLAAERFLVEPGHDYWDDFAPELVPATDEAPFADLARDRLRWTRDAFDPHGLWMYPRWMGVRTLQLPGDLWAMQELLAGVRPATLVETGVFEGGSTLFYASLFELMGRGRVVAVELRLRPEVRQRLETHPLAHRITLIEGDSASADVVAQVSAVIDPSGPVVVALDSDHSTKHVARELGSYEKLVDERGRIVVFDTAMSLVPRHRHSNPHLAVKRFLAAHPEWGISREAGASFACGFEDGVLARRGGH